ncbi:hypothetical protein DSO57_1012184 [Entomophthora muscae]|uniref:Uncharacterized protein n=1 Tax=Entomophthora muscae TaxID=34485 RepID=A0ACC2TGM3_9FUNG|nr:hypothetical protein DSO57_1012184 [Entomophthora muscae]
MSVVFLVEILLRMRVEGIRYWLSVWSILDMSVVVACMIVELLATFLKNVSYIRYDWLFMSFRMWYAVRMIRIVGVLKGVREDKLLVNDVQLLLKCKEYVHNRQSESHKMEQDLSQMQRMIRLTEAEKRMEQKVKDSTTLTDDSSSWNSIVPQNTSIRLKSPSITKALSSSSLKRKK